MNPRFVATILVILFSFFSLSCSGEQSESIPQRWRIEYGYTSDGSLDSQIRLTIGIASYAKALGENNKVFAEARLLGFATNEENISDGSILVEEIHYGKNGKIAYQCESLLKRSGIKVSETKKIGTKHVDFFSEWPMSSKAC